MMPLFPDSAVYTWVIIPFLIFIARIADVSIGTMRLIFISRGFKLVAPLLGFFEVLIWLLAIQQVMSHLTNFLCYLAYGAGFATGTFVGIILEEKISIGKEIIRIITKKNSQQLVNKLQKEKYTVTCIDAKGSHGKVKVVFTIINRHDAPKVIKIIKRFNPNAFYSIEDVRFVNGNGFRGKKFLGKDRGLFKFYRKGK